MTTLKDKIKSKALPYILAGISIFGGIKQTQAQDQVSSTLSSFHNKEVAYNAGYRSFSESLTLSFNDKSDIFINSIYFYEIGDNGYQIMSKRQGDNKGNETSTTMISPDGRKIDISFFNTKDFMIPPEFLVHPETAERDPEKIKENNDIWEMRQRTTALKKIDNPADREAFYEYVEETRNMLEKGIVNENLTNAMASRSHLNTYSVSSTAPKSLSKEYRRIKKQIKEMKSNAKKFEESVIDGIKSNSSNETILNFAQISQKAQTI